MEKTQDKVKTLKQKMEELEKAGKMDTAEYEKLGEELKKEQEHLEELKKKAKEVSDEFGNPISREQYEALQREIIETEQNLEDLERQARQSASVLGSQMQAAGEKIKNVGDKVAAAGKAMMPVTTAIVGIGGAAVKTTADFDVSMSRVSAVSGAVGEDFDRLRDKARQMGRDTIFSAAEAADAMNYMAMAGWDTEDMLNSIDGVMNLAAASGEDLASVSDIVTDAMTAFGLSADGTSKVLKDGVEKEVSNATRFSDVLAQTIRSSNTDVLMLGETFKYVAPLAGAMGYSVEDMAVLIGLMANSGIKGAQAGTALRSTLTNLANPTDDLRKLMDEMGISLDDGNGSMLDLIDVAKQMRGAFGELKMSQEDFNKALSELDEQLASGQTDEAGYERGLQRLMERAYGAEGALKASAAATVAGKYGMSGLIAMANATEEDFEGLKEAINNSSGATEEMSETMRDNLSGQLKILKSQLAEAAIAIGDTLMPAIRDITSKIQEWVDKFNGLSDSQKKAVVAIGLIAAAIGPLLIIIGTLISSVGSIVGGIGGVLTFVKGTLIPTLSGISAPIVAIVLAIAAVIAAFVDLWRNNEEFRNNIISIWNGIKDKFSEFAQAITDRLNGFGFEFESITEVLSTVWKGFCELMAPIFEGVFQQISNILGAVLDVLVGLFDVFAGIFTGDWDQFWTGIQEIFRGIWDFVVNTFTNRINTIRNVADTVLGWFGSSWNEAWSEVGRFFEGVWNGIVAFFTNIWEEIKNAVNEKTEAVKEAVNDTFTSVKETASTVWEMIKNTVTEKIEAVKTAVHDTFTSVKETVSIVWETIKNVIQFTIMLIAEIISAAFQIITLPWRMIWENTKEYIFAAWEWIKTTISNGIEAVSVIMGKIGAAIGTAWEKISDVISTALNRIKTLITEGFNAVKTTVTNVMEAAGEMLSAIWERISTVVSIALNRIKTLIAEGFNAVKTTVTNVMEAAGETLSAIWERISTVVSTALDTIKTAVSNGFNIVKATVTNVMEGVKSAISQKLQNAYDIVSGVLGNIKSSFSDIFENVKNTVKNAIEKIKSYFNFNWSLPELKMPHFNISGSFKLNPPSVPHFSVEWYRKAMDQAYILKGASIFGEMNGKMLGGGEAGSEIVAGTQYMMDLIRDATAQSNYSVAEAVGSLEHRVVDIMSEYFPRFAEKGEMEQYIQLDPHFSVMVGNRQFDSYIVQTAEKGISGQQRNYRKAKGAG